MTTIILDEVIYSYAFQTLVGVDVDKPEQMTLRAEFNITGFPTLYYFV